MKTIDQLKELNDEYSQGLVEWSDASAETLDKLIADARLRDGVVALDILARIPSSRFSEKQAGALFESLLFWIQGPSRFYDKALALLQKHGKLFLPWFQESLRRAVQEEDDSLVQGLCHVFSLLDFDVQRSLNGCVQQQSVRSKGDVKEILQDLGERCRAFDLLEHTV